jgi:hypothetical protein
MWCADAVNIISPLSAFNSLFLYLFGVRVPVKINIIHKKKFCKVLSHRLPFLSEIINRDAISALTVPELGYPFEPLQWLTPSRLEKSPSNDSTQITNQSQQK